MNKKTIIPIQTLQKVNTKNELILESLPPLSLYIHFPWCVKKCPYCDFNSHSIEVNPIEEIKYLDALCKDLEESLPLVWGRRIHSIFIGGGTPSLLSAEGLDRLLADVRARIGMDSDIEITLEANPSSVEAEKFASYAKSGINRISLGIQSFNERHLKDLGRVHNKADAIHAIHIAKQFFQHINLDLMYGLPMQSLEEAIADIDTALSFNTDHLSLYQLTLEPNTLFAKLPPPLPDEDLIANMQNSLLQKIEDAGLNRYEVSAYSKKGGSCFHNINYWTFGDYLGIGAGAHGKISFPDKILRTVKERHPATYMQSVWSPNKAVIEQRSVAQDELAFEFMLGALRLKDGVPMSIFEQRTGLSQIDVQSELELAMSKGLLDTNLLQLKATPLGLQFLNDLQELFLPVATDF
jgi:oxygen-independent coproporphyrinogen-3 oxidase